MPSPVSLIFFEKNIPEKFSDVYPDFFKGDELELERAKKEQAECKKRVTEASRVLGREEPNLAQARQKLEHFSKTFEFLGVSIEENDQLDSGVSSQGSSIEASQGSAAGMHSTHSSMLQMNDDCLMPSYESKAIIQKTPKKVLQGS